MHDTDSKLLERYIRTSDALAFDQLARRYRGMVFSTARRVTRNHHDAEDVAQGCFLELARQAEVVRVPVSAYLHSTATRRSIDLLRERARRRKHEQQAAVERDETAGGINPAERSWDELSPEVDQAIEQLPEKFRVPIMLYYLRGLTDVDIAGELRISRGSVMRRLQVGARRLRAALSHSGAVVALGVLTLGLKASSALAAPASLTAATGRMALAARLGMPRPAPTRLRPKPTRTLAWLLESCTGGGWFLAAATTATMLIVASAAWLFLRHPAPVGPYDRLHQLYAPYLSNDPAPGFAWHASSMESDLSSFWRGSQPLFYQWCKANCPDWFADQASYVVCQASPNLEDAEQSNPDNSARLPLEIELLQGLVTVRLAASGGFASSGEPTAAQVASALCDTFRASLLRSAAGVATVEGSVQRWPISRIEAQQYIDHATGEFESVVLRHGRVQQFLRPARLSPQQAASLINSAAQRCPALLTFVGGANISVRSVAAQVRYDSVVTQGQSAFLVLLDDSSRDGACLIELKQQLPSPAELAGAVPRDSRTPARRAAEDARELAGPVGPPLGWAVMGDESFAVRPFDPETLVYELRKERWLDAVTAARAWATSMAATHRAASGRTELAHRITPALVSQLIDRCDAYTRTMRRDYESFCRDSRVAHDRILEDSLIAQWLDEARAAAFRQSR